MPRRISPAHLLVVGATGALLPAVHAVTDRGDRVTALARTATTLADLERRTDGRARPFPRDVGAPGLEAALASAARDVPFTGALLYCPFAGPPAVRTLVRAVPPGRPVVLVLTSAHAAPVGRESATGPWHPAELPPEARPAPDCRLLVLGWHEEGDGAGTGARWHTPEEISTAALDLWDAGRARDAVLGTLRPWGARPGSG
ncbi:hypothetical protein ACGFZL_12875 [Streptomyces sp. NPDC048182]|uniref:hypothetical protein n=1 Tax=Streptomyces sp. NPDC048182 TaxID=3365507 RepID=UPI00371772A8